jgi:hypothetical protein
MAGLNYSYDIKHRTISPTVGAEYKDNTNSLLFQSWCKAIKDV